MSSSVLGAMAMLLKVKLGREGTEHFLLHCPMYLVQRQILLNELLSVNNINVTILLHGNSRSDANSNLQINKAVSKYITTTKRFAK